MNHPDKIAMKPIDCHQSGMTYRKINKQSHYYTDKPALQIMPEMINRQITLSAEKSPFK